MKLILFCLFSFCVCWSTAKTHKLINHFNGIGEPDSPTTRNALPENKWFIQKLDHFNSSDTRTWRQKYQVNWEHYKNDGPVFLMIGGEGPISSRWMHSGAWIEYAKEFNALCFQLEHRYYGNSHPTKDTSSENLVYLSSEQALADLAEFIVNIQTKYKIPSTAKWVSIGGSYAGSLSAWLRMKYPHIVHAAISTSSPLLAQVNFKEYFDVVTNALATYNVECVLQIKKANRNINLLLKTNHGAKIIEKKFKLCQNLDRQNKKDVATLYQALADNFAGIVQYNKDNRYYKNPEQPLITLEYLCDIMVNKSIPTSLDRYAAINRKLLSITNSSCLDHIYSEMIDLYSNTTWDNNEAAVGRSWTYQTCTEFGFYQTSDQVDHVFGHSFPVEYFIDLCTDIFGKTYNSMLLSESIKRTNTMYGELNIRVSRVIFVHGSVDPWHALGITQTRTKNNIAIFINGTSHCANMYPSSEADLPQLTEARATIRAYLKKWLMQNDFIDSA